MYPPRLDSVRTSHPELGLVEVEAVLLLKKELRLLNECRRVVRNGTHTAIARREIAEQRLAAATRRVVEARRALEEVLTDD